MTLSDQPDAPEILEYEIERLRAIVDQLFLLDQPQRRRVLSYAAAVFGVDPDAVPVTEPERVDEVDLLKRAATWAVEVLQMVDAKQLKQQALDGLGLGDDADITDRLLELIKRAWLQQAATPEAVETWLST